MSREGLQRELQQLSMQALRNYPHPTLGISAPNIPSCHSSALVGLPDKTWDAQLSFHFRWATSNIFVEGGPKWHVIHYLSEMKIALESCMRIGSIWQPSAPASRSFLKHTKHTFTSGSLHRLFLLPEILFPQISTGLPFKLRVFVQTGPQHTEVSKPTSAGHSDVPSPEG